MQGIVNKAIQDLITSNFGAEKWEQISEKAGFDAPCFLSMDVYPDELTYKLVSAASDVLGISPEAVLETFGEYWILYTASEGYGKLIDSYGQNLRALLHNLDGLHARLGLVFADLRNPSFRCHDLPDGSMLLHYRSVRTGLAPMVAGLLRGLGSRFETPVQVCQTAFKASGADQDEFHIQFVGAG